MKHYSPAIGVSPSQVFAKKPDLNFFRKLPWKHPGQRKIFVSASAPSLLQILGFDLDVVHGLIRNKTRITINENTSGCVVAARRFYFQYPFKQNQTKTKQNKIKERKKKIIEKKMNCVNVLITNVN